MSWYDINTNANTETKNEYLKRIKYETIICKKAKSFMDIVDGELSEGIQYRIVTENSFNAITVIEYLTKYYKIISIDLAIYRMNLNAVNYLKKIIESESIKCNIVLSSFFRENKRYEKWANDIIEFSNKNKKTKVLFAWNHAKVFLANTKCGKYIVFEGSGNLSDNARIEQYIIENNQETYNFHKKWIHDILNDENRQRKQR